MSNISLTKYSKSESLENREFSVPKILDNLIKFSIDQNSTRIEIKIERNGLSLIEIRNNGIGMSPKDLEDSIKGHSNILSDKNIFLDISKISKLEIISKEKDKTRGSLLKITNDKIMPIKQCYADIGTKVSLKDFFYNNHKERVNPENFIEEDIKKTIFNYAVTFPKIDFFVSLNKRGNLSNTNLEAINAGCCTLLLEEKNYKTSTEMTKKFLNPKIFWRINRKNTAKDLSLKIIYLFENMEVHYKLKKSTKMFAKKNLRSWDFRIKEEINTINSLIK